MFDSKKHKKVFVGLSGGVDSAVSAALLKEQGYDVTGVFIRIALKGYPCTAGQDKIDAMRVAAHLRIPFIEVDLSEQYRAEVFAETVREYALGRTPNPDTLCNQKIKFGHYWEFAKAHGADFIATGHYARTKNGELFTGLDDLKDQSYFLWMVPEVVLRQTLFPVGGMHKSQVRALAKKFGLPNAARPDSQGLCFLGDTTIEDMLDKEMRSQDGAVLDEAGAVIGVHRGAAYYTLGQRHGFSLNASTPTTAPHFVIAKDAGRNTITVSESREPTGKSSTQVMLAASNWLGPIASGPCAARFRYRGALSNAQLNVEANSAWLKEAHYIPEGQSLVLYRGERCLGGGIVDKAVARS